MPRLDECSALSQALKFLITEKRKDFYLMMNLNHCESVANVKRFAYLLKVVKRATKWAVKETLLRRKQCQEIYFGSTTTRLSFECNFRHFSIKYVLLSVDPDFRFVF